MKLQILIDNRQDLAQRLNSEHGLSIYMENPNIKILVDTGLSGKAMDNADVLGIDISDVDYLILSHGHRDHAGGLEAFLNRNHKARIICSRLILDYDYTSDSRGKRHSLNPDKDLINSNIRRFVFAGDEALPLSADSQESIITYRFRTKRNPKPNGNRLLNVNGNPYSGDDEMIVSIINREQHTVISPCSHSGLLNILESANMIAGMEVSTFVGGLHYIDGEEDILNPPSDIKKIYTGHCTGMIAQERLRAMLGERIEVFRTGDVIYC